jgi:hypothetical protein
MSIERIYPVSLDQAARVADAINLPVAATFIEPTGYICVLLTSAANATLFVLRFNEAKLWTTDERAAFLMIMPNTVDPESWLEEQGMDHEVMDITTVWFETAGDKRKFEDALWS